MNPEKIFLYLKKWDSKQWFFAVVGFSVLIYFISDASTGSQRKTQLPAPESVDTYIPKGFVLIPIKVQNFESLDSILGQYGVVDLYKASLSSDAKTKMIASGIRILRSPLKPNHFGVLAPESQAHYILSSGPLFWVTLKNPNQSGTKFVKPYSVRKRRMIYE